VVDGREFDIDLRRLSGAHAYRAVHTGAMRLAEHRHDWPCLVVHLLGRYEETNEEGTTLIEGPAAVLHKPGSSHAESFSDGGAEVLILHFDPAWLQAFGGSVEIERPRAWVAGAIAAAAGALHRRWDDPDASEHELARKTAQFLRLALSTERSQAQPPWIGAANKALASESVRNASDLALRLNLDRAWCARSYRSAMGEGLRETIRRRRVEQAMLLLRRSAQPIADIAFASGFCDQSHMNRAVKELTSRTPLQIRSEAQAGLPISSVPRVPT
jgi:AraC family transcriptional regulator